MTAVFLKVIDMSVVGAYAILAVLLLRQLFIKAPKYVAYFLWAAAFLRLLCPLSLTGRFSLRGLVEERLPASSLILQQASVPGTSAVAGLSTGETLQAIAGGSAELSSGSLALTLAAALWISGMLILTVFSTVSYWKLRKRLSFATLVEQNVLETDQINTPFVLGIYKPKIYLPVGLPQKERDLVLMHERTHIARRDYRIKPIAFAALILHWFNPLVWVGYFLLTKDMEMSCDESVMRRSKEDVRSQYATSLLSFSMKQSGLVSPLAFGETNVHSRIRNILNYKKPKMWIAAFAIILGIAAAVILFTDPEITGQQKETLYANEQYGFSLELPEEFAEKIIINAQENEHVVYFISKQIGDSYPNELIGIVGRIEVYDKRQTSEESLKEREDAYNLRLLAENNGYYICWAQATDVQIPPGSEKKVVDEFYSLELEFKELIENLTVKEVLVTTLQLGFVKEFDTQTKTLTVDPVEWITWEDRDKIFGLGLDANVDLPNGYYIYNEDQNLETLKLSEQTQIEIVDWENLSEPKQTDVAGLEKRLGEYDALFHFESDGDEIIRIWEQYRP